eukprot:5789948-Heterocapsa_arctica.AAC.1
MAGASAAQDRVVASLAAARRACGCLRAAQGLVMRLASAQGLVSACPCRPRRVEPFCSESRARGVPSR